MTFQGVNTSSPQKEGPEAREGPPEKRALEHREGPPENRALEHREGPPDAELVRRVLEGEADLFRFLVRRYGDVLHRHAERMVGHPDIAADLVQSAFVKGYRNLHRCQPEKCGGWLFRILSNQARDFLRDPRRGELRLHEVPAAPAGGPGPDEELEQAELGRALEEALGKITPEQREAFVLKHYEGHSYEEMSEMLAVAPAALKMRVHRAREALQRLLEGES